VDMAAQFSLTVSKNDFLLLHLQSIPPSLCEALHVSQTQSRQRKNQNGQDSNGAVLVEFVQREHPF
jgi:hypothetical protein